MNIYNFISKDQKLPESFIEKFEDKLDWNWICKYQKLSPKFIIRNIDKITKTIFENKYYKNLPENIKILLRLKVK